MFSNKALRSFLLGGAATALVFMPPTALAADLTHSPVVGGVTTSKAKIQFRTDMATTSGVVIQYATTEAGLAAPSATTSVATAAGSDFTATVELDGLTEDQTYFYKILVDGVDSGSVYKFNTPPPAGAGATCTLAVFADVSNEDLPAPAYAMGHAHNPTMAFQIGDFNHGSPFNPRRGTTPARDMHKLMRDPSTLHGADFVNHVASQMPLMHIFDDHDYCGKLAISHMYLLIDTPCMSAIGHCHALFIIPTCTHIFLLLLTLRHFNSYADKFYVFRQRLGRILP